MKVLHRARQISSWHERGPSRMDVRRHAVIATALAFAAMTLNASWACGQGWEDFRQAGRFVCHADFRLDRETASFAGLRTLESDVVQTLGVGMSRERVEVYLFQSKRAYRDYLERRFPGVPIRRALYIKGAGPGMVHAYLNHGFEVDLRHEATHALLHSALPVVPLWLDEGLAEYFEVPRDERVYDHPHLSAMRRGVWLGRVPRLDRLETKQEISEMRDSDYRDSWAWVHFMLHGPPEANAALRGYLADISSRTPPGLLQTRLESAVPDTRQALKAHFRSWSR